MRKRHVLTAFKTIALLAPLLTAACSGGGGGGGGSPVTTPSPMSTATTASQPTFCSGCVGPPGIGANDDTGITGPIAAPASATFGTAAKQTALPGGPAFDGSGAGYPANVTFPLITTGLLPASPGLAAATGNQGATLTVVSTSSSDTTFQLVIPGANVNTTFTNKENLVHNLDGWTSGQSYVAVGFWGHSYCCGPLLQSVTEFSFGYETPASAMPTSGTANFAGSADANVFKTVGTDILQAGVSGNAALSVNFGSGQVTGALTKMQQWDGIPYSGPAGYLPWNDVSISGNIASGTNRFSGSTAVTSTPGTTFSLVGSAAGHIDGALYGPAAQNVGAVWSLSDGTTAAIGTLSAKQ